MKSIRQEPSENLKKFKSLIKNPPERLKQLPAHYFMIDEDKDSKKSKILNLGRRRPRETIKYYAEIERENQRLKNDDYRQDIQLKAMTRHSLFKLLFTETIIIFVIAFLQGWHLWGFDLKDNDFKVLVGATLLQISSMVIFVVKYLFSGKKSS